MARDLLSVDLRERTTETVSFDISLDGSVANDVARCRHTRKKVGEAIAALMKDRLDRALSESVESRK